MTGSRPAASPHEILVIEDNPGDRDLVQAYLGDARQPIGFVVDSCDRLACAIDRLSSARFDAVVADLGLPDSQGLATLEALRARSPDTPVLVLTGNDDAALGVAAVQAGAADFLSKGRIDDEILPRAIRYAIERAASEKRYRQLFEGSLAGVYVTSYDGTIINCNDAFVRLLRYPSLAELKEAGAKALYKNPSDRDAFLTQLRKDGEVINHETPLQCQDGSITWVVENAKLFSDSNGNPTAIEGTVIDLTARKESERRQSLVAEVLAILNRPNDWTQLIEDILKAIRTSTGFEAVGIRLEDGGDYPYAAVDGFSDAFLAKETSLCAHDGTGAPRRQPDGTINLECMCGTVIRGQTDPDLSFFTTTGSFWTNSTTDLLASTTSEERRGSTRNTCNAFGYESVALVPVRSSGSTIGLLQLNDSRCGMLTLGMVRFLEELAASIGVAFRRQVAERRIESLLKTQMHINRLSFELGRTLDLQETYSAIYEHICRLVDADAFIISLFDADQEQLTAGYVVTRGCQRDTSRFPPIRLEAEGRGTQSQVVRTREPLIIPDWQAAMAETTAHFRIDEDGRISEGSPEPEPGEEGNTTRSALLAPMQVEGRILGVLQIQSHRPNAYTEDDAQMLSGLANVSAVAVRNAQLVEAIEQEAENANTLLAGTTRALSRATETRDPYTAGHQLRVSELAVAIGEEMDLDVGLLATLHIAGLLHDIGKMSVPAEILVKPTRLTDTEFSLIKEHVQCGFDILKEAELPWEVAEAVLQHHERLDGSGYPRGVRGEGIMLEARILGVADVVEAMSSHRPYRPALGIDAALAEIEERKGDLFDVEVVDACLALIRKKGFKFSVAV